MGATEGNRYHRTDLRRLVHTGRALVEAEVTRCIRSFGLVLLVLVSCTRRSEPERTAPTEPSATVSIPEPSARVLYLPDADSPGVAASELPATPRVLVPQPRTRCPSEMVDVRGLFCIDRFETSLADGATGQPLSPYYHPTAAQTRASFTRWQKKRHSVGSTRARALTPPPPPEWQLSGEFTLVATSKRGIVPSGYMNREVAERACRNAGKRLCTAEEWVTACRGERGQKFPYGAVYRQHDCNVFRATHPAAVLHGDPSIGHLDPRLNQVLENGKPLLQPTGSMASCASRWGSDHIYDMVGNLDEWVDDPQGTFVGGFYARSTREGCDARVEVHAPEYFDYSLGTRCCR